MLLLIGFVSLALGVSFLCSILEAVLLRTSVPYIAEANQKGLRYGRQWEKLRADIDRPLAAILSLNTIAHTVGAAGAGAQATKIFGEVYFGVISAVLTLLILVFSEIVPKTLGALHWRRLAPVCADLMLAVVWLTYPLVLLSQVITRWMAHGAPTESISRDEFVALAETSVEEGVLAPEESALVSSLLRFRALQAKDIMTPRVVLFTLDENKTVAEVIHEHPMISFSRIPVYSGETDHITGFVRKDDILYTALHGPESARLSTIRRDIFTVPHSLTLGELQMRMITEHNYIVLLVDEYGSIQGLVSMEDLVETMLGLEIVDETDTSVDMQKLARDLWLKRARQMGLVAKDFSESETGPPLANREAGKANADSDQ